MISFVKLHTVLTSAHFWTTRALSFPPEKSQVQVVLYCEKGVQMKGAMRKVGTEAISRFVPLAYAQ